MKALLVLIIGVALGLLWWKDHKGQKEPTPEEKAAIIAEVVKTVPVAGNWHEASVGSFQLRENGTFTASRRRSMTVGNVEADVSYTVRGKWHQNGAKVELIGETQENATVLNARIAKGAIFKDSAAADGELNQVRRALPRLIQSEAAEPASFELLGGDARTLQINLNGSQKTLQRIR